MHTLFSKERVNTGRQMELDLAKTLTIALMIWIHIYENHTTLFEPSISAVITHIVGSIAVAVTFMLCMGIGISYTGHNSAKNFIQRGFKLITIGFVLEIFREVIPGLLELWIFNNPDELTYLVLVFSSDILHFAGLAFLLVGVFKILKVGNTGMLLISIALSALGTLLEGLSTGCYPVDQFLGFFWGTYSESYFPLFNWFIFVAAGQWFGDKYQFLQDKKRFHAISLLVGALLCAAYVHFSFNVEQNLFKGLLSERFLAHRPLPDALICLPINLGLISLCYFMGLLIPRKVVPVLSHPSRHITQYYCISWVIITSTILPLEARGLLSSDLQVFIEWLCISAATILAVIIYSGYLKDRTESFFGKHRIFWTVLVWTICIATFLLAVCTFDVYPNFMNGYG